jgi:hypothetical protein
MGNFRDNNALFELTEDSNPSIVGDLDSCRDFVENKEGFKLI